MPFDGSFTQEIYAQKMIDEYVEAGKLDLQVIKSFSLSRRTQTFDPHLCLMYINTSGILSRQVSIQAKSGLNHFTLMMSSTG